MMVLPLFALWARISFFIRGFLIFPAALLYGSFSSGGIFFCLAVRLPSLVFNALQGGLSGNDYSADNAGI